jgi:hypothetical protein
MDIFTLAGTRTIADPYIFLPSPSVWAPYAPCPTLTVAQLETDILSVTSAFSRKAHNYKWSFSKDFRVNDIFTMRKEPWLGQVNRPLPIFQEEYVPHLAVELGELEGVPSGCVWMKTSTRKYLGEVHLDGKVQKTDFHAIVTPTAAAEGVVTVSTVTATDLPKEN